MTGQSKTYRINVMAKNFGLQVPPVAEQRAKSPDFLDRKTGQIDELIRIKERRIAAAARTTNRH